MKDKKPEIPHAKPEESPFKWTRKDLLSVEELSKDEIELVLQTAESLKEVSTREVKKVPALRGKTVANLFFESSTRTRTSFELAAKRLSADIVNFSSSGSSTSKGESLRDTARNVEAMRCRPCRAARRRPSRPAPSRRSRSTKCRPAMRAW